MLGTSGGFVDMLGMMNDTSDGTDDSWRLLPDHFILRCHLLFQRGRGCPQGLPRDIRDAVAPVGSRPRGGLTGIRAVAWSGRGLEERQDSIHPVRLRPRRLPLGDRGRLPAPAAAPSGISTVRGMGWWGGRTQEPLRLDLQEPWDSSSRRSRRLPQASASPVLAERPKNHPRK